jgi:hypothetical protein
MPTCKDFYSSEIGAAISRPGCGEKSYSAAQRIQEDNSPAEVLEGSSKALNSQVPSRKQQVVIIGPTIDILDFHHLLMCQTGSPPCPV